MRRTIFSLTVPRALVIETSARVGCVALAIDGAIIIEQQFEHGLQNAAKILPIIDELCRGQRWAPGEIEHIYISIGPGSFTGLRIGVTIAKTLALTTGAKIVAVPSLLVLAHNAPMTAKHVVVALDAKRGQVYAARFERRGEEVVEIEPPHLGRLEDVLSRSPQPVHLITEKDPAPARAEVVAQLGWSMAQRGHFADPDRLIPVYIRLPEAEEKWLANQGQ